MIKNIFTLLMVFTIFSCASVQNPTGGNKDTTNPILVDSKPIDQSILFDQEEIKLYFNEWMKMEQLDQQLIITPREDITYEADLNKQELTLTLQKPLRDSVTYTLNFRQALKDITEGNLWQNPIISFSTGPYLDSMTVTGTVTDLKTNKPQAQYIVGLYSTEYDTANLRQGKPIYFTTTDTKGNFRIQNIKTGNYKLYTFQDNNNNLLHNPATEAYGFLPNTISLYDSLPPLSISTYKQNEDTLRIKKATPAGKDFTIQYNKGLYHYTITNLNDLNQYIYANNIDNSQYLRIYKENFPQLTTETDSIPLEINAQDSIGSIINSTIYYKTRSSRLTNDSVQILQYPPNTITDGKQSFNFSFTKPISQTLYDSIQLRLDNTPIYTFKEKDAQWNFNKKQLTLYTTLYRDSVNNLLEVIKQEKEKAKQDTLQIHPDSAQTNTNTPTIPKQPSLHLYLGKGAFIGIENDSTNQFTKKLTFKNSANYGKIKGSILNASTPFIIELLNDKFETQDTIINHTDFQFDFVPPGKYSIRILLDTNNNQKWDAGDPFLLQKQEQYHHYQQAITVKANWEIIDQNIDLAVDKKVNKPVHEQDL